MGGGGASAAVARDHTRELHAQKVAEQRTCVVKGLGKHVATSAVCAFMEPAGSVQEVQRVRKTAFVTFTTARQAAWAVERLNNQPLQGLPLQVFLLGGPGWAGPSATADAGGGAVGGDAGRGNAGGDDASGDGAAGAAAHTVSVGPVPGAAFPAAANRADAPPEDSAQSPPSRAGFTGLYLVRLLRLWRQKRDSADALALLRVVTAPRSRQAKEVCEAMAVSQALFDFGAARKLDLMRRRALVFVPGDGNRPNAAAALALHVPDSWRFYSIDPVLRKFDAATLGPAAARLHVAPTMLEEFPVPASAGYDMCIIIAVHCHAPLTEFWARLPPSLPALCVSLPCCGDHGWLSEEPAAIVTDPEVPSEKNTFYMYFRPARPGAREVGGAVQAGS